MEMLSEHVHRRIEFLSNYVLDKLRTSYYPQRKIGEA